MSTIFTLISTLTIDEAFYKGNELETSICNYFNVVTHSFGHFIWRWQHYKIYTHCRTL